MSRVYETEGVLEGDRLIRLKAPLPCKEGPVKVVVTPQPEAAEPGEPNYPALEALDRLLAEPDDLTREQWEHLEEIIQGYPLRILKGIPL